MKSSAGKRVIDTKTIIINLLNEDQKTFTSISRLHKLISFIYNTLTRENKLDNYITFFDLNFDAIERTVMYNNSIFWLDIERDTVYLREKYSLYELVEEFKADEDLLRIITDFKRVA